MKKPGKPEKKGHKAPPAKNFDRGTQKPARSQKIIKPTNRGR
jgi:hypothetical protein